MTTRSHLGEQPTIAPLTRVRASPELIASLRERTRYIPPSASPAIIATEEGEILEIEARPVFEQPRVARYPVRHTAVLVNRNATTYRPIDALERARLWTAAVALERKTKSKGSRRGALSDATLLVYNALLFRFASATTGRCDPSYDAIQAATGKCRSTVATALQRLAATGLLIVTRRWLRVFDPETGQMVARQITNSYSFPDKSRRLFEIPSPVRACGPVPKRTRRDPLGLLGSILRMSLVNGQNLKQPTQTTPNNDPRYSTNAAPLVGNRTGIASG